MDVYRTDRIRNVVLLGHGGSGKTTLAEAMAYLAGMTNRLGRVEDGNTVSDFDKEEIKRHFSISTTLIPVPWDKVKINVLDTPGYFDFVGEVEEAVSAADAAIIVVSGKAGVQVGTQKAWNLCEKYKLPRMFFDCVRHCFFPEQPQDSRLSLHSPLLPPDRLPAPNTICHRNRSDPLVRNIGRSPAHWDCPKETACHSHRLRRKVYRRCICLFCPHSLPLFCRRLSPRCPFRRLSAQAVLSKRLQFPLLCQR